jgi:hypothetical protein
MKFVMKLTLVAAALAIGTGAALADDQHLQSRLASEQAQNAPRATTTVAVYANHQGVIHAEAPANDAAHYEVHLNAHGIPIGN